MAVPTKSLANQKALNYEVTWKGDTIGYVESVDLSALKNNELELKTGEFGPLVIDKLIRGGLSGTLKTVLEEAITERLRQLMPWAASTGAFAISPGTAQYSKYDNSGQLVFHPVSVTGTQDDFTILHAFPNVTLPNGAGDNWQRLPIDWDIFPDRTALLATPPVITYGYRGPAPS